MEIIFLGTSCMQPTKDRNHAGVLIIHNGDGLLFDCGEGIQRQMRKASIKPTIIKKIFISHWHGDHVLGLPGLLQTMSASEYTGTLQIYGPKGTKKFMSLMMAAFLSKTSIQFELHEVDKSKVVDEETYMIESDNLLHSTLCIGYSFIEKDRRKINMREIKKMGIPEGPLIGKLQQGDEVTHKGKKITPNEVSSVIKGRKIVYITDTRPCEGASRLAKDADLLILESTYASDMEEKAKEYFHLTAKEAALIASRANVKRLILTHFSIRYKEVQTIEEDAREIFDNTQTAQDFMKVKIP